MICCALQLCQVWQCSEFRVGALHQKISTLYKLSHTKRKSSSTLVSCVPGMSVHPLGIRCIGSMITLFTVQPDCFYKDPRSCCDQPILWLTFMQWLVFRRDGSETAAAWAQKAAEATASNTSIGDGEFMDFFEPQRRLQRRQAFVCSILRQTMQVHMQGLPLCMCYSHVTLGIAACANLLLDFHSLLSSCSCKLAAKHLFQKCFLLHH